MYQQPGYPQQQGVYGAPAPQPGYGMYQPPQMGQLQAWFMAVDQDRSGRISADELRAAFSSSGREFSVSTATRLIRIFDGNNSGTCDFNEFAAMFPFIEQITTQFRSVDRNGSGRLEGNEVRQLLANAGFCLAEPTFQTAMRTFDKQRCGGLQLDGFLELSILLGATRNTFAFYDRARTNQVTFNFDSFTGAALTLR